MYAALLPAHLSLSLSRLTLLPGPAPILVPPPILPPLLFLKPSPVSYIPRGYVCAFYPRAVRGGVRSRTRLYALTCARVSVLAAVRARARARADADGLSQQPGDTRLNTPTIVETTSRTTVLFPSARVISVTVLPSLSYPPPPPGLPLCPCHSAAHSPSLPAAGSVFDVFDRR